MRVGDSGHDIDRIRGENHPVVAEAVFCDVDRRACVGIEQGTHIGFYLREGASLGGSEGYGRSARRGEIECGLHGDRRGRHSEEGVEVGPNRLAATEDCVQKAHQCAAITAARAPWRCLPAAPDAFPAVDGWRTTARA